MRRVAIDEIAAANDLTLVAAGRAELQSLFPRDEARSTYAAPQRILAMTNVAGVAMELPYAPRFLPVKFNFFAPLGEAFWVPWYSKDGEACWGMRVEAKPGGPFDRYRDCVTGGQVLERTKQLIREFMPWDAELFADAELADGNAWLAGAFTPEVRQVVGTLPSGRHVMAVGDTGHSLDPIGGQGANNGNKMVRVVVEEVVAREERPFDADWLRATFDRFWERHRLIDRFNNTLLEPLTPAGRQLLVAQYGSDARPGNTRRAAADRRRVHRELRRPNPADRGLPRLAPGTAGRPRRLRLGRRPDASRHPRDRAGPAPPAARPTQWAPRDVARARSCARRLPWRARVDGASAAARPQPDRAPRVLARAPAPRQPRRHLPRPPVRRRPPAGDVRSAPGRPGPAPTRVSGGTLGAEGLGGCRLELREQPLDRP